MSSQARTSLRHLLAAALVVSPALLLSPRPALAGDLVTAQDSKELLTYVHVGDAGAKAYNLADSKACDVRDLDAGTVLAVHAERAGWLDCEAPGGFRVWVWGEYLQPAAKDGHVRVTGDDVRMRPLPSSGIESYALIQKLDRGQDLVLIGRKDESKPMDSDWVQVWSPPGARAWVRKSDTVPLAAGESGAKLWGAAVEETLAARKPVSIDPGAGTKTADAGKGAKSAGGEPSKPVEASAARNPDAESALAQAETLFAAEMAKDDAGKIPDYDSVKAAYEKVLALEKDGPSSAKATARLLDVGVRSEAYALRRDMEIERTRREESARRAREALENADKNPDPLFGRFAARGWLERRVDPGRADPVWVLHFSGEDTAELACFSGRYDLSLFEGFELGVNGKILEGPVEASSGRVARAQRINVDRIEVLSSRAPAKR